MKRFIEGDDRTQQTLFPASLDEYIDDENMVHVIDAFEDVYICPAGNRLTYRYTRCEDGLNIRAPLIQAIRA